MLIMIARTTGPSPLGVFSFAIAAGDIVATTADFGLSYLTTREVAANAASRRAFVNAAAALKLLLLLVGSLIGGVVLGLFANDIGYSVIILGILSGAARSLIEFCCACLNGLEEFRLSAVFESAAMVGGGLAVTLVMLGGATHPQLLLWAFVLAQWTALVGAVILTTKRFQVSWSRPSLEDLAYVWRNVLPFASFVFSNRILVRSPEVLLGLWWGASVVGLMSAALRIIDLFEQLPAILAAVVYPRLAAETGTSRRRKLALAVVVLTGAGVPASLALVLAPELTLRLIYGSAFTPAGAALAVLAAVLPLRFANHGLGIYLSASGNQAGRSIANGLCAGMMVVGFLTLGPRYGVVGAAIVIASASALLWLLYSRAALQSEQSHNPRLLPAIVLGLLATGAALALPPGPTARMVLAAGVAISGFIVASKFLPATFVQERS